MSALPRCEPSAQSPTVAFSVAIAEDRIISTMLFEAVNIELRGNGIKRAAFFKRPLPSLALMVTRQKLTELLLDESFGQAQRDRNNKK